MSNLKPVASWLSTAALIVAVWLLVDGLIESKDLAISFSNPGAFGAAILSLALGAWNPPAKPGK